jgi:DMSO/TMAO reductase YedYZ heme-binding membrane subunit
MPHSLRATPTTWWQGWQLLALLSAALLLMAAALLMLDPDVDGVRRLIRYTARSSLVLFLLAFTASAAARQVPGAWTRWQLRNRRYLGLGFAVSHAIHLAAIVAFARLDPTGFHGATNPGTLVSGGLAYLFIAAMSVTSFDAAVAWMGAARWKRLHLIGLYYIWISFVITFGKRIPISAGYALPVLVLLLALAVRLWPRRAGAVRPPTSPA